MSDPFDVPFDSIMFPDRVRHRRKIVAPAGTTGGRRDLHGQPGDPLPCCFRYAPEAPTTTAPADATKVDATLAFPANPGTVSSGDLFVLDIGSFKAIGPARRQDQTGHLWVVRLTATE